MATSIKVMLLKKANKEGLFPLAIRIIKNRKPSYIYIGHYLKKEEWNEAEKRVRKNHPNSSRLNNLITVKLAEASATLIDLETSKADTSSRAIKKTIKASEHSSFFKQAEIYLAAFKAEGKFNRESADKPRISHFREFIKEVDGRDDIPFSDISVDLLHHYRAWLRQKYKHSEMTIINHQGVIRTIFNRAIANKLADQKYYPFGIDKILIRIPKSAKIGLLPEDVRKLEEAELPSVMNDARNKWLISYYFAGVRISDVLRLKWSEFQNDRLYYTMGKNGKADSLKIPEKAFAILNQYRRETPRHDLVFPDLEKVNNIKDRYEVEKAISGVVTTLNAQLKRIAKKIGIAQKFTAHISRHTFGNIAGDKIPIQMLQKLYRHTDIRTTVIYQSNFLFRDTDDALDAVLG